MTRPALALLVLLTPALAQGESVPLHLVPRPVLDAVAARFNNARVLGADRDRDGGGFVYEVTVREGGRNVDVTLTPDGVILLIKRDIAPTALPPPVARAVAEAHPGATYDAVEAVTTVHGRQETLTHYEIDLVTPRGGRVEVRVSADGRVLGSPR